jgi:hypothetical protein
MMEKHSRALWLTQTSSRYRALCRSKWH